jgi:hypothetical protein
MPNANQPLYLIENNTHYYRIDSDTKGISVCVIPGVKAIQEMSAGHLHSLKINDYWGTVKCNESDFIEAAYQVANHLNYAILAHKKPIL